MTKERLQTTDQQQRIFDPRSCYSVNLGLIDYNQAWKLQSDLVAARIDGMLTADVILFLEHPAVFTLGRRGGLDHLLVSEDFLRKSDIPIVHIERGGYITFHGPGQLVVYLIIDFRARRIGVEDFVAALEDAMLRTVDKWNISAERNPANRGIWVGSRKMGSIGIALRKGFSFHGLALNVNIDLTPFTWIQPCGLQDVSMTSMGQELGQTLSMDEVQSTLKDRLEYALGLDFKPISLSRLQRQIKCPA